MRPVLPTILFAIALSGCGGGGGGAGDAQVADPGTLFVCDRDGVTIEDGGSLGLTRAANVQRNPFGTVPLGARLQFCTPEAGTVQLTVLGKTNSGELCSATSGIEISHQFGVPAMDFDLPVLGLYPDYANTLVVEFFADSGAVTRDEVLISTSPLPIALDIEVEANNLPADDAGLFMFSGQKAAFDQCGEVRWFYDGSVGFGGNFYEHLPTGNWLGSINQDQISYHYRGFAEFSMLGEQFSEYSVPNYAHHEIQKLPWGNYLVGGNFGQIGLVEPNDVTQEDTVVEIDADTGAVVKVWDLNKILDPARQPIDAGNTNPEDWLHLNSAVYDAADDTIVITAQRQSLVAKFNYDTGNEDGIDDLVWVIAPPVGWSDAFQGKLLSAVDAQGDPVDTSAVYFWPYGPHSALVYPDRPGVIAIFDNGLERGILGDRTPTGSDDDQEFSRGVEYLVDTAAMTVEIVWQFDWDQRVYNQITGDIDYLANGDYLLGFVGRGPFTDYPRAIQVDVDGNIQFNALANRGQNQYRVEKIDLYRGQGNAAL